MAEINTSEGWAGTNPRSGSVHDGYLKRLPSPLLSICIVSIFSLTLGITWTENR
ncbi:MAG: hypothetical protein ACYSSP_14360 [Planctomycetota bacterium]